MFPPSLMAMRCRKADGQESIVPLWTTWEFTETYKGQQIWKLGQEIKAKIVNCLIPKWNEHVDETGNLYSGTTWDDVLESVRRSCWVDDEMSRRKEAANSKADRDVAAEAISDEAAAAARQTQLREEYISAIEPASPTDTPATYEPFAWLPFKLFSVYGHKAHDFVMFDIFSVTSRGEEEGKVDTAGAEAAPRGPRGRAGRSL
jgi:hypothetical protein